MYSWLLESNIIDTLLTLFVITYYALLYLSLNFISSIFYILSGTKLNYSTKLQKVLKYSFIFLKL